ncbi:MAG: hypothetical protein AAF512_08445, partial [Pseudomonadota bacterium]
LKACQTFTQVRSRQIYFVVPFYYAIEHAVCRNSSPNLAQLSVLARNWQRPSHWVGSIEKQQMIIFS